MIEIKDTIDVEADCKQMAAKVRALIRRRFQGRSLEVDGTDTCALATRKTAGKLTTRSFHKQSDEAFARRMILATHLDELLPAMDNVRREDNRKSNDRLAYLIKGEVEVCVNGVVYQPTIIVKVFTNGHKIIYDIAHVDEKSM